MTKEAVRRQIEAAFADTPAPGKEFEDISASMDDEGIVAYFRGRPWRGHRVKDLREHEAALSLFTDKAFRYWLPAFMLAELEDPEMADVIAEGIAFHFTKAAEARLQQFTPGELEAIAGFFDECARNSGSSTYEEAFREAERSVHGERRAAVRPESHVLCHWKPSKHEWRTMCRARFTSVTSAWIVIFAGR
ncbi:MAG: hypothetical protein JWO45_1483 [Spartobacteria bacterium]|nr:hypothetical protein [Spartobacteria bacterium]